MLVRKCHFSCSVLWRSPTSRLASTPCTPPSCRRPLTQDEADLEGGSPSVTFRYVLLEIAPSGMGQ
eukprot:747419-Hanusia_phi.AAC.9